MSLVAFTAAMTMIGPEGENGNIYICWKRCIARCKGENVSNYNVQSDRAENLDVQMTDRVPQNSTQLDTHASTAL